MHNTHEEQLLNWGVKEGI